MDRAPDLARRINVDGTRSLIEQMESSGTANRLVFASSQGVFGDVQDREPPLRVDTSVSPTDEYGRHKVACEQAIQQSRLQWSILRLAAVTPIHLIGHAQDPGIMFEFSPEARFEFLHPADAGTAFARAVACEEAIGKILNIAGGEKCRMTYYEFCSDLMSAIGIGPLPTEAFVRTEVPRFFGDWLDTEESQRLLQYQKRGLSEQKADMRKDFGAIVPLIRLLRPRRDLVLRPQLSLPEGEPARGFVVRVLLRVRGDGGRPLAATTALVSCNWVLDARECDFRAMT